MANLNFKTAFKYPFNRAKGMWNVLWILLPIIGWFALGGYGVRIIQEFSKGKFKKLPVLKFKSDFKLGFFMFLKAIPFVLAYMLFMFVLNEIHSVLDHTRVLLEIFIVPILTINFINKQTVGSFFEFKKLKYVFTNLGDYIVAVLKSILLFIVFLVMCLILVGIPAMIFTENMFLADFYRRKVK
jgi:hypothetical protein